MADLSILEFIVYTVIGYSPLVFMMGYILTDKPATKSNSIMRVVYVMPGLIGVAMLASVGGFDVTIETTSTQSYLTAYNASTGMYDSDDSWFENVTQANTYTLENPVWITFNGLLFVIYMLYIVINILNLIAMKD